MINKTKKRGFTLVEVIIVLAIIAIIAAIAIPNLTQVRQDSKKKADMQTCETIKRTMTTLIVDEKVKYNTSANANTNQIVILANGAISAKTEDVEKATGLYTENYDGTAEKATTEILSEHTTYLENYFTGLKVPQQDDGYGYLINIDKYGTVASVKALKIVNNVVSVIQ